MTEIITKITKLTTEKWVCLRCHTPNYVMRKTCHECGMSRASALFGREPKLESDELVEVKS